MTLWKVEQIKPDAKMSANEPHVPRAFFGLVRASSPPSALRAHACWHYLRCALVGVAQARDVAGARKHSPVSFD